MGIKELIAKIEQWGKDRELDKKATVEGQAVKTAEEMAELIIGISKDKIDVIEDSIGDVFVTLVIGNMINRKYDMSKIHNENKHKLSRIPEGHINYDKPKQIRLLADKIDRIIKDKYVIENLKGTQYLLLRIADIYDLDFVECVESAYNEIKDRTGKTINGQFIKSEDLDDLQGVDN
ncbi:MAG: MazG-like family protein [Peptoniphilus harei]|nr:MazG-like family protein [Peptoniphilus harei]